MAKKTSSEGDNLQKDNRELRQENQSLKKQLKRLRKKVSSLIDIHGLDIKLEDEPVEQEVKCENVSNCTQCSVGKLKEVAVGGKVFLICDNRRCLWRVRVS